MTDLKDYLTIKDYSERVEKSQATLGKWIKDAIGTRFELGEPDHTYGVTQVWHIDKWERLRFSRLADVIDEAVGLKMVIRYEDHESTIKEAYENGFKDGQDAARVTSEPEDPGPDFAGLTYGGFQPITP